MKNINELNKAIENIHQFNQLNAYHFNKTMKIMQAHIDNYITKNELTISAINDTLQYVQKIPMVIVVPSLDEIYNYRGKITQKKCFRSSLH